MKGFSMIFKGLQLAGALVISIGVAMIYFPAGLIVLGISLVISGELLEGN